MGSSKRVPPSPLEPWQPDRRARRRRPRTLREGRSRRRRRPGSDGLLVILTPQDMTDPTAPPSGSRPTPKVTGKPVLASWMGGPAVAAGDLDPERAGIPTFAYPDTAARAFTYMWKYTYNLRSIYETPEPARRGQPDRRAGEELIDRGVRDSGRTILTEFESKQILAAYGIPTVETRVAAAPTRP